MFVYSRCQRERLNTMYNKYTCMLQAKSKTHSCIPRGKEMMGGLGRRLLVPTNGRTIRGHVKGRQGWPRAGLGVIAGLVGYPSSSIARGKQPWALAELGETAGRAVCM